MKKLVFAFISTVLLSSSIYSKSIPRSSPFDTRVKSESYNAENVSTIRNSLGYVTSIIFSEDEVIEDAVIGVNSAWDAIVKKNVIYLKSRVPNQEGISLKELLEKNFWNTNLTVKTNKRFYLFDLTAVPEKNLKSSYFLVRFKYPNEQAQRKRALKAILERQRESTKVKEELARLHPPKNWHYKARMAPGSADIAPSFVYDDGTNTYLGYEKIKSMPSVFQYKSRDNEMIVNSNIRAYNRKFKLLVINKIAPVFVLRQDNKVVGIYNLSYGKNTGIYQNTDSDRVERVTLHE